jgi:hypothetical protein
MSKAKRIQALLKSGKSIKEVAKATKSSEAYVYYVRWTDKKGRVAKPENPPSKILKAALVTKAELDALLPKSDPVNSPPHYRAGGVETIDFIEAKDLNYRLGNVVKYVSRAGKKDSDPLVDLKKARWYLDREIFARERA